MSNAVVHDGAVHPGGAVKVVIETARALDADLVIGISGMNKKWWASRIPNEIRILSQGSKMGTLQDIRNAYRMMNLSLNEYDIVITSGPATKFFQPYDQQTHVHYLHHPPLSKLWFDGGLFAYLQSFVDRVESISIPIVIANSTLTAERFWKHYGHEVNYVVNPPVTTDSFSWQGDHVPGKFVMVGRLEDRKRPFLAVEAFEALQESEISPIPELHLLGGGPHLERIQKHAPRNVIVHGYVDDDELVSTLESSYAGIFLAEREDFGITPIEYMAAGLPVLGVDEPNTNNQIEHQQNGILVRPDAESICSGIIEMMEKSWDRKAISECARMYNVSRFHEEIQEAVADV